jgi:hypothetical protein
MSNTEVLILVAVLLVVVGLIFLAKYIISFEMIGVPFGTSKIGAQ